MALNLNQQIIEAVGRADHILLASRPAPAGIQTLHYLDGFGAALGFLHFLNRLGKKADLVARGYKEMAQLAFLPKIDMVKPEIQGLQKFTINLDVSNAKVNELSYELKDNELQIFVTPERGLLKPENIKARAENFKYDLIITLDAPDLESLGEIFEKNSELFFKTPIINIDHQPENEHFGAINAVDLTASATSEIVYEFLENWDRSLLDEHSAICLLTGLIAKTQSFQKIKSPRTFQTAGRLVALGADREKIMQNLYRSKSLATFRLWGVTLAHLKHDPQLKFAWSTLTARDFLETSGEETELPAVIQELVLSSKETEHSLLLYEKPSDDKICGLFFSTKIKDVSALILPSLPADNNLLERGAGFTRFCLREKNMLEAEKEMVDIIKKKLYNLKMGG